MSQIQYETLPKTVQDIVNLYEKGQLNLEPGFQRSSVWQERDRRKLIDSILRNYPLPSVFIHRNEEDGNLVYDVIDGKQRIESILMFMGVMRGNRFWTKTQLPGQEQPDWVNWRTLEGRKVQNLITGYKLHAIEVSGDPGDVIDLFVRINSTGKALTGQEKRHAKYYTSPFLRKAGQLARRFVSYLRSANVLSPSQITRMKHVELVCELLVSAFTGDVINKKAALDKIMQADSIKGRDLEKATRLTVTGLNRVRRMFPHISQTRFRQLSDFYSLAVLVQKLEKEGLILSDRKRNKLANDLLLTLSNGVDDVRLMIKKGKPIKPGQELYRDYLLTVLEATDKQSQRRRREEIIRGLLASLFARKDSNRLFSQEQRRILWNTVDEKKCMRCKRSLTWSDFTIDHIKPHSRGGRTALDNAALMCGKCQSIKGNR
ncbi:MAG: DUF262 domain-containing protein [Acidobacteriia bacterium]|nr:DUF262 domain-containing protein [Terriglobia bacterium]